VGLAFPISSTRPRPPDNAPPRVRQTAGALPFCVHFLHEAQRVVDEIILAGFERIPRHGIIVRFIYARHCCAACIAGHTGVMTMDEARQMALDFAKLPELLKQNGE
jgi:hypothetical protein